MSCSKESCFNVEAVDCLDQIFQCFICMGNLQDARMCPHCSKLCCNHCILRWLTETRAQCPHCRANLTMDEVIVCRWAEEVNQHLETLQQSIPSRPPGPPEVGKCSAHQLALSVYCDPCKCCICPLCALFNSNHANHVIKQLDEVYPQHSEQIQEQLTQLRKRFVDVVSSGMEIEKNIEAVRTAKDQCVRDTRNAVELMIAKLDTQLKEKLIMLMNRKRHITHTSDNIECLLQEIEHLMSYGSKSEIIGESTRISQAIQDTLSRTTFVLSLAPVLPEFDSKLVPNFENKTFLVTGFSSRRRKTDPFYCDPLFVNGLEWRLKVYPDGNGVVRGSYLSLFLELSGGPPEPSKYEYRISMIYQLSNDPSKNMVREFASEFEVGECWGYNRFFRLDLLESEGFFDRATDTIKLRFDVRPPTYHQKSKDQAWHITNLQAMNGCNPGDRDQGNPSQAQFRQSSFPRVPAREVAAISISSGASQDNAQPEHENLSERFCEFENSNESQHQLNASWGAHETANFDEVSPGSLAGSSSAGLAVTSETAPINLANLEENEIEAPENVILVALDNLQIGLPIVTAWDGLVGAGSCGNSGSLSGFSNGNGTEPHTAEDDGAADCNIVFSNQSSPRSDNDSGGDSHDIESNDKKWDIFMDEF